MSGASATPAVPPLSPCCSWALSGVFGERDLTQLLVNFPALLPSKWFCFVLFFNRFKMLQCLSAHVAYSEHKHLSVFIYSKET